MSKEYERIRLEVKKKYKDELKELARLKRIEKEFIKLKRDYEELINLNSKLKEENDELVKINKLNYNDLKTVRDIVESDEELL